MIICINYNTDGSRYIAKIDYLSTRNALQIRHIINNLINVYDEVYALGFNGHDEELVNAIVLEGCRML